MTGQLGCMAEERHEGLEDKECWGCGGHEGLKGRDAGLKDSMRDWRVGVLG